VDVKTIHSVFRLIASVLAIGASVIFGLVLGSLFQRERARELVAEIGRVMKRDSSRICAQSEIKEDTQERLYPEDL
jgi:hypothetical protein